MGSVWETASVGLVGRDGFFSFLGVLGWVEAELRLGAIELFIMRHEIP